VSPLAAHRAIARAGRLACRAIRRHYDTPGPWTLLVVVLAAASLGAVSLAYEQGRQAGRQAGRDAVRVYYPAPSASSPSSVLWQLAPDD
jgi:hypothetical protein